MDEQRLADFLKNRRIKSGLTQSDVAQKLGYTSPQFISNWERGLSCPPVNVIAKLSDMYEVHDSELFEMILSATLSKVSSSMRQEFKGRRKRRA